jgi:hypothetical protein
MPEEMREAILRMRRSRPSWGPKKIKASLEREENARKRACVGRFRRPVRLAGC